MVPNWDAVGRIDFLLEALLAPDVDAARDRLAALSPSERRAAFGLWGESQELGAWIQCLEATEELDAALGMSEGAAKATFVRIGTDAVDRAGRAYLAIERRATPSGEVGPQREQLS